MFSWPAFLISLVKLLSGITVSWLLIKLAFTFIDRCYNYFYFTRRGQIVCPACGQSFGAEAARIASQNHSVACRSAHEKLLQAGYDSSSQWFERWEFACCKCHAKATYDFDVAAFVKSEHDYQL